MRGELINKTSKPTLITITLVAACVYLSAAPTSQGAIIATYAFTGADPGGDLAAPVVPDVVFSSFSRSNLTQVSFTDQFVSTAYTTAAAIDLGEYVEFTVTANPGFALAVESISFKHTRNDQNTNNTGPKNGEVRASFESYAAGSGTGSTFSPANGVQNTATWNFTDYQMPLGGSVSFRIYGWNSPGSQTTRQLRLDDVALEGVIVPVPEPATLCLGTIAAIGVMISRRKRSHS